MQLKINDPSKWNIVEREDLSTLQLFITNECNLKCPECFYATNLNNQRMSFDDYRGYVQKYCIEGTGQKVILIGGEPSLHPNIKDMVKFNNDFGLKTTIYTNGSFPKRLEGLDDLNCVIRVGVHNYKGIVKPIFNLKVPDYKVTIVFMMNNYNYLYLPEIIQHTEKHFNCEDIYISTIRDLVKTKNFWLDTNETIPLSTELNHNYPTLIQYYLNSDLHLSKIKRLHVCRRGVIDGEQHIHKCRYLNILPDGRKIICPWDIAMNITTEDYAFKTRTCNKNYECILQKLVFEKK